VLVNLPTVKIDAEKGISKIFGARAAAGARDKRWGGAGREALFIWTPPKTAPGKFALP
jgi:hypothetical protein